MDIQSALQNNLSIRNSVTWIPDCGIDDNNRLLSIREAIDGTGISVDGVRNAIYDGRLPAQKDRFGFWQIRLKDWTKYIERYRYGRRCKLGTKTGRHWGKEELYVLALPIPHKCVAEMLNRSIGAVKIKRCKLKWKGRK